MEPYLDPPDPPDIEPIEQLIYPLISQDRHRLWAIVEQLKQSDGESWAVGEVLTRALLYIAATIDEI